MQPHAPAIVACIIGDPSESDALAVVVVVFLDASRNVDRPGVDWFMS